jgi:peptide/nickel transport system substrate-binding protein
MPGKSNGLFSSLSRRAFMGTSLAMGVGTLAPLKAFGQSATTPRKGGILRVNFPSAPDTPDPHMTLSGPGQVMSGSIFENLTELDANDQPIPRLATSWKGEKGGQEWVFDLRTGVKFHHGREFTSEDVVATINRSEDRSLGLRSGGAFGPIQEAKAEGPNRVRLVLKQPCAELPVLVASRYARIIPADRLSNIATDPVGTGPFKFKSFQPGTGAELERNPNYWRPDRPYLDGIRFVAISQSVAQQAALRGGNVDILEFLSADGLLALKNAPGVKPHSVVVAQYYTLMTQANLAPFDNPKVRNAFKYILDRESLIGSALLGEGIVANDTTLAPGNPYLSDLPQYKQDLPKAQALLKEAGITNLALELYTSSERQPSPKIAVAFKEAAEKIGVGITIRDVPFTEYLANVARKKPLYTSQWNDRVSLYESLYQIYYSKSPFNYSGVEQYPGLDRNLEDLIAELDLEKRKKKAAEVLTTIHTYGDRIIPFFMNYMCATSDKVQNFTPPKHGASELRDVWLSA